MQNQRSKRAIIGASLLFATPLVSCGDDDALEEDAPTLEVGQSCTPKDDMFENLSCDEANENVLECDRGSNTWKAFQDNPNGIFCDCNNDGTVGCGSVGYSGITSQERPSIHTARPLRTRLS